MGEQSYYIKNKIIRFREEDSFPCLCTFPHNDHEYLQKDRVRSLAVFGAVVRLVLDGYYDDHEGNYIFIPGDVPNWILSGVESHVS